MIVIELALVLVLPLVLVPLLVPVCLRLWHGEKLGCQELESGHQRTREGTIGQKQVQHRRDLWSISLN